MKSLSKLQTRTRIPRTKILLSALVSLFLTFSATSISRAAELKPDTISAWDDYIRATNSQMAERLRNSQFLWADESPVRRMRVQRGEIVASPMHDHSPRHVPSGLIHDWIGAAFFPEMSLHDVFSAIHDYDRYKEFYKPLVVDSKLLSRTNTDYRFSILMLNKSLFSHTALAGSFEENFIQVSGTKWYSVAQSTSMQEVEGYGQPTEHRLSPDEGSGYIWRLYGLSRFEERDGGVYVEVEVIALSRDIPSAVRWFVEPIVRRVAKDSLVTSLHETKTAVKSKLDADDRGLNGTKASASLRKRALDNSDPMLSR